MNKTAKLMMVLTGIVLMTGTAYAAEANCPSGQTWDQGSNACVSSDYTTDNNRRAGIDAGASVDVNARNRTASGVSAADRNYSSTASTNTTTGGTLGTSSTTGGSTTM